jgi:hypothetical protein
VGLLSNIKLIDFIAIGLDSDVDGLRFYLNGINKSTKKKRFFH